MAGRGVGRELTFSDLATRASLKRYLDNVRAWHGYIRFLGLPDRRDNPDVIIDRLFVEPLLIESRVMPEDDPLDWSFGAETVFDVLKERVPLVLLGDPGSGKSTLLNYLVWLLARPEEPSVVGRFGNWLLPVPITLRELTLHGLVGWDQLIEAFLRHPMSSPLGDVSFIEELAEHGRVLFLIDGIDEIGDLGVRRALRDAVHEGFLRYSQCSWVLTSRIVGYEDVPFHVRSTTGSDDIDADAAELNAKDRGSPDFDDKAWEHSVPAQDDLSHWRGFGLSSKGRVVATTRYIAPFDDQRIATFARHWYVQREAAAARAGESAEHLVRAIHEDPSILRLARIPNLLTMMALIHRIETTLPHGRALLYDRIGEAYLESIDKFRGVYSGAFDFQQKRSWLARVGFELQRRRSGHDSDEDGDSHLLATKGDVLRWITDEMARHHTGTGGLSANEFLDIVGRRSGLFLPRGEGRYAFVHLSFQEYFAALAVEEQVTSLSWAKMERTRLGVTKRKVRRWATQTEWFETFSFLFELLAPKTDWHRELVSAVFESREKRGKPQDKGGRRARAKAFNLMRLMLRLVGNPRSGLPHGEKEAMLRRATRLSAKKEDWSGMFGERSDFAEVFQGETIADSETLTIIVNELRECNGTELNLYGTKVQDLSPLSSADFLRVLLVGKTKVDDLEPVRSMKALWGLRVDGSEIRSLEPIRELKGIELLSASHTKVEDVAPVGDLHQLQRLNLDGTEVGDLSALRGLSALEQVSIARTRVRDLAPLSASKGLKLVDASGTGVCDLKWVRGFTELRALDLRGTEVTGLEPLSECGKLRHLVLWDTAVSDVRPLAHLAELTSLDLDGTLVTDFRPLSTLRNLQTLHCSGIKDREVTAAELQEMLPECKIYA